MLQKSFRASALVLALSVAAVAQTVNSDASQPTPSRERRATPAKTTTNASTPAPQQDTATGEDTTATAASRTSGQRSAQPAAGADARAVREAFDTLIDGIRRADVDAVMGVYWNSPRLVLFNNNGTVTKTWEQVKSNRASLYAKVQDVKLDVRDVNVQMTGRDSAVVTCLWEQSQVADGQPERATGRLTLVFQKIGAAWKAVHAHTSPDRPDPSRLLPSERTTGSDATEKTPAKP